MKMKLDLTELEKIYMNQTISSFNAISARRSVGVSVFHQTLRNKN